jgi:DNA-binding transcriptional LysR family regulator
MIDGRNLTRVLPDVEEPHIDAYFVYPEELRNSKRIQVFRDFLIRKIAQAQLQ